MLKNFSKHLSNVSKTFCIFLVMLFENKIIDIDFYKKNILLLFLFIDVFAAVCNCNFVFECPQECVEMLQRNG